MKFSSQVLEW